MILLFVNRRAAETRYLNDFEPRWVPPHKLKESEIKGSVNTGSEQALHPPPGK